MTILLAIISGLLFVCLVLCVALLPERSGYSLSEIRRRSKRSKKEMLDLRRYESYPALVALFQVLRTIFLVLLVCALVGRMGWEWGVVWALVAALIYPVVARIKSVRALSKTLYDAIEQPLLTFAERFGRAVMVLREPLVATHSSPRRIFSHEDLAELIQNSKEVIGPNERLLLTSALTFSNRSVSEIMTPRSVINFIKKTEFLGPLVLDELHALGNSRLPVISEDLDHIVGILHIRDLLSLNVRESTTAQEAMEKKVYYIREDDTLEHALAAFLRTRHHLFIVINEHRETVGLLTLEDVIEALIGRKIVDEDDIHEDMRAVAAKESKTNNVAPGHVDL